MKRVATLIVLAMLAVPSLIQAQQANPLSLSVGDRIRLREPGISRIVTGTVARVEAQSFSFSVPGETGLIVMPYAMVDTIVVRRRQPAQSAMATGTWGLFLGAALGAITGPFAGPGVSLDTGPAMAAFTVGGGTIGAAIGGAIGAFLMPERWYRHVLP